MTRVSWPNFRSVQSDLTASRSALTHSIRLPSQVLSLQGDKKQRSMERKLALLTQAKHLWIQECIQLPEVGVHN